MYDAPSQPRCFSSASSCLLSYQSEIKFLFFLTPTRELGLVEMGAGTFFALFSTPCQEERSTRAVTRARRDCGWAPLMSTGAAGGSAAPEQVHQESWDSAPRGACPPPALVGSRDPSPQNPPVRGPLWKNTEARSPPPVRPHAR